MSETSSGHMGERNQAAWRVAGVAIALAIGFHLLFTEQAYGIPHAIFLLLILGGVFVVGYPRATNSWAYLFLLPFACALIGKIIFASVVIQIASLFLACGSLILFAYWLTTHRLPLWSPHTLWPSEIVTDTLWPFKRLDELMKALGTGSHGLRIVLGLLISIPFVLLFGSLFSSADQLFGKAVSNIFADIELPLFIGRLLRDLIVGFYFLGAGWIMVMRRESRAHDAYTEPSFDRHHTTLVTFLSVLNILFLTFLGFQFAYFFGGEAFIQGQGVTYAEYARSGFFELLAVGAIVFGLSWAVYRITNMKHASSRMLNAALIIETGIIIVSAARRLSLYIDAYGLTVSRLWASIGIAAVGIVLLAVLLCMLVRASYVLAAKHIFFLILSLASVSLFFNADAWVARYNLGRYERGTLTDLDVMYLSSLSEDAIPALHAFVSAPVTESSPPHLEEKQNGLRQILQSKKQLLLEKQSDVWMMPTLSEKRALRILERISL